MDDSRTERIGGVTLDYSRYPGEDLYCDGAVEDELLRIAREVPAEQYPALIREKKSWEVLYHLSDLRENIVAWLPIDKTMKVLEVGSGCGAITGCLARMAGSVTCVDLSRKRSLINAYRHRDCGNVTIHVGNFTDIEPDLPADYDYVCLIGAFEYGQSYIPTPTPFEDFYRIVRKHVRPGGRVVIAIENKMGLKYWAGCREDHLGTFFSGLEDYPGGGAVRTFIKDGLERILQACGETEYHFYYPYPDYKFMTTVYSDRRLPKVGELSNNLRNFDRDRILLFDEKKVFDMLIREGLFPLYSNSYLIVTGGELSVAYSRFSNDRAKHLCIQTQIGRDSQGRRYVRKLPAQPQAVAHVQKMAQSFKDLTAWFSGSGLLVNRLEEKRTADGVPFVELEFLEDTRTLEELLDDCLQRNDEEGFARLFSRYREVLSWDGRRGGGRPIRDFDLTFPNICVREGVWTVIDYEWVCEEMDPEEIVRRALYCYILENDRRKDHPAVQKAMREMGMGDEVCLQLSRRELAFQQEIMQESDGTVRTAVTDIRHLIGNLALPFAEAFGGFLNRRIEIFEDYGDGYRPENSYHIQNAYVTDSLIRTQILCKKGVRGIRLDPAEEPCLVQVRRIALGGYELTAAQLKQAVVTNGETLETEEEPKEGMACVFFDTADPNINVRLDGLWGEGQTADGILTLEAYILHLTPDMQTGLRAKTTRRKRFWFQK